MFGNFIYLIVALLIYTTYSPSDDPYFPALDAALLFWLFFGLFAAVTRLQFKRIEKQLAARPHSHLDPAFEATLTRQTILAVALFALNIYGLGLPSFFSDIPVFRKMPTLLAVVFIGLFVGYMAVVWSMAYRAQRAIYGSRFSRSQYVLSKISFILPVLLPWLLLSGVADVIQALPFQWPKRALATTAGEILYFLFFLLMIAIIGPALIQRFWQCRPLENGYARERIENLCRSAGLQYRDILHWPIFGGRMITAGVMGLVAKFRYILVTEALLGYLTADEIDAVIAHEIGHVKRRHLLFYLFFFIGYMLLSYATFDLIVLAVVYSRSVFGFIRQSGLDPTSVTSVALSIAIIAMFLVYFRFVFGYFMRNFERQADLYVFRLFDTARPLISTLTKIAYASGQSPDKPNWHHFSIAERVAYLNRCEADRRWIAFHDRKINKSIGVFLLAMAVTAAIGYQLNFGDTGRRLNRHFFETVALMELEKAPENPELLTTLGDIFYEVENYRATAAAYERGLRFDSQNAHILNNLAWLYATCPDDNFRDAQRALVLAEKAAGLDSSAHVWDTLAESYYANGRFSEAAAAGRRALQRADANRTYYEEQLKRFEKAAAGAADAKRPAGG